MSTNATAPAPAKASTASVEVKPVQPKKSGFDPLRPVRYASGFIDGTVTSTFDTMATWARRGSKIGLGLAALAVISGAVTAGIGFIAAGWAAGLVAGAAIGGVAGAVTGGIRGIDRETRKEKYADDLMRKAQAKSQAPSPQVDYRRAHRAYKRRNEYLFDRMMQQDRENASDTRNYFQNLVDETRGRSHGQGF